MLELVLLTTMLNVQLHRFRRGLSASIRSPRKEDCKPSDDASDVLLDTDNFNKRTKPLTEQQQPPTTTEQQQPTKPVDNSRRARRRQRPVHVPRVSHSSAVIASVQDVSPLQAHLPVRYQACDWQNVYSTMRHGISLQTFYMNCAGNDPIVVLIRDDGGGVFGAYSSVPWKSSKHYYGTGEGFVFTIAPNLAVYKWSRANSFFQLGSNDSIALGGGGKFALFLDSMFEHGSSGPCATFNNPCLASEQEFNVVVLEAYKLVSPYRFRDSDDQ